MCIVLSIRISGGFDLPSTCIDIQQCCLWIRKHLNVNHHHHHHHHHHVLAPRRGQERGRGGRERSTYGPRGAESSGAREHGRWREREGRAFVAGGVLLPLVLSLSHCRRCIHYLRRCSRHFLCFSGACVSVASSPQALSLLVSLPLVFFHFCAAGVLFTCFVAEAFFRILAAGASFVWMPQVR